MEVKSQNGAKSYIECLLYIYLFVSEKKEKKKKGVNTSVRNIPCNLLYIGSKIYQWKANIEFLLFFPPPTILYQCIGILWKDRTS